MLLRCKHGEQNRKGIVQRGAESHGVIIAPPNDRDQLPTSQLKLPDSLTSSSVQVTVADLTWWVGRVAALHPAREISRSKFTVG